MEAKKLALKTSTTQTQEAMKSLMVSLGALPNDNQFLAIEVERAKTGKIILPEGMTYIEGAEWLKRQHEAQEKVVSVSERIDGFPLDVAHALGVVTKERYGYSEAKATMGMFGPQPPKFIAVPVDAMGNTVSVLVGQFTLPGIDGKFATAPDDSTALVITGAIKQKSVPEFQILAKLVREKVRVASLYQGKAIKIDSQVQQMGMVQPTFINTDAGNAKLILNRAILAQIEATVINRIRFMDRFQRIGTPIKQGVLFKGPYGTGKTLCASEVAREAVEAGWTYVYCQRPEDLIYVYATAKQWQSGTAGVVVFVEDIDRIADDPDMVKHLSLALDGVDTKDSKILLVATTNHPDKVPEILARPGRFDNSIYFRVPDAVAIRQLVEFYAIDQEAQKSLLGPQIDWPQVVAELAGNIPAVIRAVVDNAKSFAIVREPLVLTTEDLVFSAQQIRDHAKMSEMRTPEPTAAEKLASSLREVIVGKPSDVTPSDLASAISNVDGKVSHVAGQVANLEGVDMSGVEEKLNDVYNLVDQVDDRTQEILSNQQ